ncbi:hypothetical protein QCN27_03880 [Cereibacter sp. SYSU M97828]|nr:hypothetical protein [Cereibacter flavus]
MIDVRVIAPMGATIRGPARLRLTPDQHSRRSAILGKAKRSGLYDLDGDGEITLKHGETLGIDDARRLNRSLFEEVETEEQAAARLRAEEEAEAARKQAIIAGGTGGQGGPVGGDGQGGPVATGGLGV